MVFLRKYKISGHSMEPSLKDGTEVLVSGLFLNLKIEDVVAFKFDKKMILKRVKEIKNGKVLVQGDNKKDSKEFGWIEKKDILGRVVFILS